MYQEYEGDMKPKFDIGDIVLYRRGDYINAGTIMRLNDDYYGGYRYTLECPDGDMFGVTWDGYLTMVELDDTNDTN